MDTDRLLDIAIDLGLGFGVARLLRGHRAGVRRRHGGNALGDRELGLRDRYEETSDTGEIEGVTVPIEEPSTSA